MKKKRIEQRKGGIGGSDAGAIMGLNPYKSAVEVYLEKIGQMEDKEDNEAMYWGRTLEEVVAREYARRTGNKVRRVNRMLTHPEHSWMIANIDREILTDERGVGVLECKTANQYMADQWKEGVPEAYLLQLMHYLAVTNYAWGSIAVLIGGRDFRIYDFERDYELIEMMILKESEFWHEHVLKEVPPATTGIDTTVLAKLYPKDNGELITLDDAELGSSIQTWLSSSAAIKAAEKKKKDAAAKIQAAMGEAAKAIYQKPGEPAYGISWTQVKGRLRFNEKQFEVDYPELYQKYTYEGAGYRRFSVKVKEQKKLRGGT